MITSWSYTRLTEFESCPLKAKLKYVDKIPDPQPRTAADRGTAIHLMAEEFVQGKIKKLPKELSKFSEDFESLREHYNGKRVSLEGEWGFDKEWNIAPWKTAWARVKLDAMVQITPTHAAVIDYKTGKKFGNEIKHGEQLQLYALATFIRNPYIEEVTAELWYLDQDDLTRIDITRQVALSKYLTNYDRRAHRITDSVRFPATPSRLACRYCPYGPTGTGHCREGV